MSDEIKEILDNMFHIIMKYEEDFEDLEENEIRYQLPYNKMQKLYDYITNLQQENEYLKKNNPEQNIEHFRIIKENKRKINNLREQNKTLQESNQNMQEEMARVWEENERLKEDYINLRNYIKMRNVSTEVEDKALLYNIELENINKKKYLDYKSRCEKAIEYIKNNSLYTEDYDYDEEENLRWLGAYDYKESEDLLNILQNGSDDNVK